MASYSDNLPRQVQAILLGKYKKDLLMQQVGNWVMTGPLLHSVYLSLYNSGSSRVSGSISFRFLRKFKDLREADSRMTM